MQSRQIFYAMASFLLIGTILFVGCGGGSSQGTQPPPVQSVVRFSSQPSTAANEGDLYTYTPSATDAANGTINFSILTAPTGATLSGNQITWTPTGPQSRIPNAFAVEAKSSAGGSASQHWMVTPTGMIRGQQLVSWHKDDGTVDTSVNDLSTIPINALVLSGGDYSTLPGNGAANGTFGIPRVPGGYYWLQFGNDYFYTSSGRFDLGFDVLGRSDAQFATGITRYLQLTGMVPWNPADSLEWYSSNVDSFNIVPTVSGIAFGDTALDFLWGTGGFTMLDDSKGDSAYLTQLVPTTYGTMTVRTIGAVYRVSGVKEIDGQTNYIGNGDSFTQPAPNGTLEGNVKGGTIAAMRPALNPNGSADGTQFSLVALPSGPSYGWIGFVPDLVVYSGPPLDADEDDGLLPYANPFDPSWTLMLVLNDWVKVDFNVPGIGPVTKWAYTFVATTSLPTVTQGLEPLVGPVTRPQVNGVDFFQDQTLNTSAPTISWSAPNLGTPSAYVITVCRWDAISGGDECGDSAVMVASFHTRNTSVQIPSGILQAGSSYYLSIKAAFMSGNDVELAPYRLGLPSTETTSLSGIMTVAAGAKTSVRARYQRLSRSVERSIQPPIIPSKNQRK